jgi:diguanylate cyclase (GGDEF)-like protein
MSAPLPQRPSGRDSAFSPLADGPNEPSTGPSLEIQEALARDQADLQREVILWQRWVRYVAIVLAGTAVVFGASNADLPVTPLIMVAVCYVVCVFATAWFVQHVEASRPRAWLPGLLATADLIAVGAIFYLTSAQLVTNRFLILATLSVALSAFYFGRLLGAYAALLSIAIYIAIGRALPAFVAGPSVVNLPADISLFVIVSAVLTYTFGQFRARMNNLRLFCKIVQEGDLSGTLELSKAKYPDDLTLLARSFESMRNGLAEQIGTDALTSCMNRRALESRLRAEWRLAKRRPNGQLALLAIDLDHFKQINDTRGHPVGDIVLQQLAGIMKSTARDTDAVSRFGGDEFVILLTDTGWQGALTFAERLRRRVDDFTFGPAGNPMTITISIGVALAKGTDPITPDELLKEADRSLYKAKQQGRNRVFA